MRPCSKFKITLLINFDIEVIVVAWRVSVLLLETRISNLISIERVQRWLIGSILYWKLEIKMLITLNSCYSWEERTQCCFLSGHLYSSVSYCQRLFLACYPWYLDLAVVRLDDRATLTTQNLTDFCSIASFSTASSNSFLWRLVCHTIGHQGVLQFWFSDGYWSLGERLLKCHWDYTVWVHAGMIRGLTLSI